MKYTRNKQFYILAITFFIGFCCYFTGLDGGFVFDDIGNIVKNEDLKSQSFWLSILHSGQNGVLKRPLSYFSFYLNILTTGYNPFYFKLTNLLIHFANSFLVFLISRLLFLSFIKVANRRNTLAFLVFAIFLLHPMALTSVLYSVQRMTSLSAFFTFLGIYCFLYGRLRLGHRYRLWFIGFSVLFCLLLAMLSKENGVLLPYYCLLIEVLVLRFQNLNSATTRLFKRIFVAMILLPVCYALLLFGSQPTLLESWYAGRSFTAVERLMTEARVLWFYLRLILIPDINLMGLYHDDIRISTGVLSPWTTLTSIIGLCLLFIAAFGLRHKAPVFSFGILFFFIGHSIESSIIALEIAHEHRNYLPMFAVIFIVVYYLDRLFWNTNHVKIKIRFVCMTLLVLALSTSLRANIWSNNFDLALSSVNKHPDSSRAHHEAGRVLLLIAAQKGVNKDKSFDMALSHLNRAYQLKPNNPSKLLTLIHATYITKQKPSAKQKQQLLELLGKQKLPNGLYAQVDALTECTLAGVCLLTVDEMNAIYNRIFHNTGSPRGKAAILTTAAFYYTEKKEYETSLKYLYIAADIYDNFKQQAKLCQTLSRFSIVLAAEKCLKKLQSREDAVFYPVEIDRLQRQLDKVKVALVPTANKLN